MVKKKIISTLFIFVFLSFSLKAQEDTNRVYVNLMNAVQKLKNDPSIKPDHWGFSFGNADSGKIICGYNTQKLLIPASTMKIIATATATGIAGPDYRFSTSLGFSGKIINDTILKGNLIIIGNGDPTLGSAYTGRNDSAIFARWVNAVKTLGIKVIDGSVISEARSYEYPAIHPSWNEGDLGNYYGAGIWALNMKDNAYDIWFKPSKRVGNPAPIKHIIPDVPCLKIENLVRTGRIGSGDKVNIYTSDNDCDRICRGTIPAGVDSFCVSGSIPNVPLYCANALTNELKKAGISVLNKPAAWISGGTAASAIPPEIIDTVLSPVLSDIIKATNYYSINVFAEGLFRACGYLQYGKGSSRNGTKAVIEYWKKKNIRFSDTCIIDGCGLSPKNKISPLQFFQMLSAIKKESYYYSFFNSLAVSGQTGTLKHVCKGTTAEGRIHAKSGYLKTARAYAGYIIGKKGTVYSFAIMINNYSCSASAARQKMEKLMILMAEFD
ncbi:MAG: D-alanyl-D-alanine carboxypeptidase/D-alanyl-D-alanine-endopeptidase [Bacteroidota bacterium]